MPIKIQDDLPAKSVLEDEHIFVMTETRALSQDIRPLKIVILNLMPTKIETETQILRRLSNTPLQIEITLLQTATHESKNVSEEHMIAFYQEFDQIKDENYDGMIITGAPVEMMPYEEVEYWDELCEIMEWSKTHVHSTFHICWGAQAEAGVYVVGSADDSQFFIMGHSEYDVDTLAKEYFRDAEKGMNPEVPKHYFPDDDPTKQPEMKWSAHGQWIYSNWMNYFVYQTTPYELKNGVFVPVE